MRLAFFLSAMFFCPTVSLAQDIEHAKHATAEELTRCAGYYLALSFVNQDTSSPSETTIALREQGKHAMEMAKKYVSDENQLGQMGGAAAESFILMSMKPEWNKLNQTYGELCESILKNPEKRFQYWLNSESISTTKSLDQHDGNSMQTVGRKSSRQM